jgi:hypothetical protein
MERQLAAPGPYLHRVEFQIEAAFDRVEIRARYFFAEKNLRYL